MVDIQKYFVLSLVVVFLLACSEKAPSNSDGSVTEDLVESDGQEEILDGNQESLIEADSSLEAETVSEETSGVIVMEIGEILGLAADAGGAFQFEIPKSSSVQSYIAVLYSDDWETNTEFNFNLSFTGYFPPPPLRQDASVKESHLDPPIFSEHPSHRTYGPPLASPQPLAPMPPPEIGQMRIFEVMDSSFEKKLSIEAECVAKGNSLAIWFDRTTVDPAWDIDAETLQGMLEGFDATVLPRLRIFLGQESDVDQDGFVHVLFTPVFSDTNIVAYVTHCDLVNFLGCPVNNQMELAYATPPQFLDAMMQGVSSILEVLAHEFQHNIYFYRKFMINAQESEAENIYIGEGFGSLAEDLSGYGNGTIGVWGFAIKNMGEVSAPDFLDSSVLNYNEGRDGALRGASCLFYRYIYDIAGSNEFQKGNQIIDHGGVEFLHTLIDSRDLGTANLEKASSRPISDVLFDWYTALAVSNRKRDDNSPLNTDPRFNYQPMTLDPDTVSSMGSAERHGVDLFYESPRMTLTGPTISDMFEVDGKIRAGGVDYVRISTNPEGDNLKVQISGEPGSNLKIRLIREK